MIKNSKISKSHNPWGKKNNHKESKISNKHKNPINYQYNLHHYKWKVNTIMTNQNKSKPNNKKNKRLKQNKKNPKNPNKAKNPKRKNNNL